MAELVQRSQTAWRGRGHCASVVDREGQEGEDDPVSEVNCSRLKPWSNMVQSRYTFVSRLGRMCFRAFVFFLLAGSGFQAPACGVQLLYETTKPPPRRCHVELPM